MDYKDVIDKKQRERVKNHVLEIRTLSDDLNLSNEESVQFFEMYKYECESHERATETAINFGNKLMNSLLLLNGGAATAIITFCSGYNGMRKDFSSSLLTFGLGILFTVLTILSAYIAQSLWLKYNKIGCNIFRKISVSLGGISFACLIVGILLAYGAFAGKSMFSLITDFLLEIPLNIFNLTVLIVLILLLIWFGLSHLKRKIKNGK